MKNINYLHIYYGMNNINYLHTYSFDNHNYLHICK